jgi:hypothetical protein
MAKRPIFHRQLCVVSASMFVLVATPWSTHAADKQETLADVLGYGGTPAEQQARFAAQDRKRQLAVVSCMRKEGFEYKAFSQVDQMNFNSGPPPGGEREYQRKMVTGWRSRWNK